MKNKSIKVYANGKRLKDVYPFATKWEVIKFKVTRFIKTLVKRVAIASFLAGAIYGSFNMGKNSTESKIVMAEDTSKQMFDGKIERLKIEVVEGIQACESKGHSEDAGLIVFDSNAKASIGTLQFQTSTVMHYYKTLYDKTITRKEAILISLDNEKAEALAKDIMFKTNRGANDWFNCAKKNGSNEKIANIKSLEK